MKLKLVVFVLLFVAVGAWAAHDLWYKDSDFRAARFRAQFTQVHPGATYQSVMDRLGKPTHYCDIFDVDATQLEPDTDNPGTLRYKRLGRAGRYELYVIGKNRFILEFEYQDQPVKYGPVRATLINPPAAEYKCGDGNEYR